MPTIRLLAAVTLCLGLSNTHAHETHAQAQYIGNEGILVEHNDYKVLFDAFYDNGYSRYILVSAETKSELLEGAAPFDGVDAVFVSHIHGDHFTAEPTMAYLRSQETVQLFASKQVVDALIKIADGPDDPVLNRLNSFDIRPGEPPAQTTYQGIEVEVVAIPHSGGQRMADVANLAFRVTLDGWPTVLHMGDADVDDKHFAPFQYYWDARTTNTAFPPYWFFGNDTGKAILSERIKAMQSIGIHVPAEAVGNGESWRAKAGGDLFTDPGEVRKIPTREH